MYVASNGIKTAVILRDGDPIDPRDPSYQENLATMTCWHSRYDLGDGRGFESPRDFLADLAERSVGYREFFRFVRDGGAESLRLEPIHRDDGIDGLGDTWYVLRFHDPADVWVGSSCIVDDDLEQVSGPPLEGEGLLGYLTTPELQALVEGSENVALMPLYLYDHSGISMSTDSFAGRAPHAEWDSGQVGFIHMTRDAAMGSLAAVPDGGWKALAADHMRAEVAEYDSYLAGEVYGYRAFEGLEEVDACWGLNPGAEAIEDVVGGELGGWFGPGLTFERVDGEDFDIMDYFDSHDFPELREGIESDVATYVSAAGSGYGPYPFEIPLADILDDAGGVMGDIVDELYSEHAVPSQDRIREALDEHAGVAREVKPKLTVSDLSPERDYTIEELAELAKKKAAEKNIACQPRDCARKPPELGL